MRLGSAKAWGMWFSRGKLWWFSVLLVGFGIAWWWLLPHRQDTIRQLGLIYEVIGVVAVVVEIRRAGAKNQLDPLHVRFARYWRRIPLLRPKSRVTSGAMSSQLDGVTMKGAGGVLLAPGLTVEQRVDSLERRAGLMEQQLGAVVTRVEDEAKAVAAAIQGEAAQRKNAHADLQGQIKEVETGGLDLSLFGVGWLMTGMLLSTATPEICNGLLQRLGCA